MAGPGLLLVSGLGGVAFALAAVVDNLLSGPQTEAAIIAVHLVIGAVSFALLGFFLTRAQEPAPTPEDPDGAGPPAIGRKEWEQ